MRPAMRVRVACLALTAGAALVLWPSAPALRGGGFGGGGGQAVEEEPAPRVVVVAAPVTIAAAQSWMMLQQPIDLSFPDETPLDDLLKYIKVATRDEDGKGGLKFYVDPVGLAEAEKTMQSPIAIDLEGVPLATSLRLALRQLGLTYSVQEDGIVMIDFEDGEFAPITDPSARMLSELSALRREVAELRRALRAGPPPTGGGMGPAGGAGTAGGGMR